jgi:hypothetical protein
MMIIYYAISDNNFGKKIICTVDRTCFFLLQRAPVRAPAIISPKYQSYRSLISGGPVERKPPLQTDISCFRNCLTYRNPECMSAVYIYLVRKVYWEQIHPQT